MSMAEKHEISQWLKNDGPYWTMSFFGLSCMALLDMLSVVWLGSGPNMCEHVVHVGSANTCVINKQFPHH